MYIDFPDISPIVFSIGPFSLRWYALAYLAGIISAWVLIKNNIVKYDLQISNACLDDMVFYTTLGIILGGRIGYVLCYGKGYFLENPFEIFAVWHGGMSFHGGIVGVIAGLFYFAKKAKLPFLKVTDLVALYTPIGIFLGRIANFVNGELWGRVTDVAWAVKFPEGGYLPRHPSQIYEALSEGVLLFIVLNLLWRKQYVREHTGMISGIFLIFYAISRMCMEFFREPDRQIGFIAGHITMGQMLSLPFLLLGVYVLHLSLKSKDN
ncbi:MAG: prolipoprotein diacylglyceryl transferase [Alphaproteobacteria bacterium]|nr:prolipoprotein diacylglyceryl transferase [Alphaproteobacteria bacterium]